MTAGFDSRMVFAASLGLKECTYFIYKQRKFVLKIKKFFFIKSLLFYYLSYKVLLWSVYLKIEYEDIMNIDS